MKVLYVAAEAVPFAKTGGLADVAGSLPKALKEDGVDVRVIMPKFGKIPEKYRDNMEHVYDGEINVAWRSKFVGLDKYELDGVTYYFVDNEEYFGREGFYGYDDDAERFSFFCRAVLNLLPAMDFWPDVINTNDWHAGLVNVFLKLEHMGDARYDNIKTVYTIHNLKYQGVFPKNVMADVLGLDWKYFNNGDLEFYDAVNFMKGGIIYADHVTTVSRTYANEIQYPYFGEHLDGLLRSRADDLTGIVNGIDYDAYNPATDEMIFEKYDADCLYRKANNKTELQNKLGLPVDRSVPLVSIVSRLVEPKGMDLIVRMMDEILQHENIQLVVLGTGEKRYEDWFKGLAWRFPKKVSTNIYFSNELAHKIYASADIFLMPSNYEPCGIGQLIALRYGTIPVVRLTGGLRDTVTQYSKYTNEGNGFTFENYNAHEMMYSLKRALSAFDNYEIWHKIQENAVNSDYSWKNSAKEYEALYEELTK
ncbi:glycogen synthase GlgA [Selenomonas sp.]|uniref:glycogen synthase GlgA n=1 Tax=Selenomonas sp. TaxID=2053611 RepID=UPI0025D3A087|nr:glycogen synthase GlgA [Selenomonas sp.]MCI6284495.1 glycogen synthase GlgA [Selenomonas sp.]